jgi:hypothetical protein
MKNSVENLSIRLDKIEERLLGLKDMVYVLQHSDEAKRKG